MVKALAGLLEGLEKLKQWNTEHTENDADCGLDVDAAAYLDQSLSGR